ncbi:MAG: altronate dehydratase [Anaerolineaceae bacterium]|nr:altronate dehydratase [Anaerolineaceae bacterium]
MKKFLKIHESDNVAVALQPVPAGTPVDIDGFDVVSNGDIPAGHKIALVDIPEGVNIIKYGFPIGHAKTDIRAGDHVHSHNVKSNLEGLKDYTYNPVQGSDRTEEGTTFMGYVRSDGSVGIRNEVWIVPTVGCVNGIAEAIEARCQKEMPEGVDQVVAYTHPYGCSQLGGDLLLTQKALSGLIRHPNAGGVLVLGLGCENNQIDDLKQVLGEYDPDRVKFLLCQQVSDEIAEGTAIVKDLMAYAAGFKREPVPTSKLIVGLKCGGSDGFSGITANPLLGSFAEKLSAQGGSVMLTEVPEMFGAETMLMDRAENKEVFEKTVALINDFKEYFMRYGEKINENPSPGNKKGGITTLEDKSLGCVQKGGRLTVRDVLRYGDKVRSAGLSLLQAPGNDLVAATALAISGAQMILFTTGRGTPFGCPIPTVKVSTQSDIAARKKNWIDFNAGKLLEGVEMGDLTEELFAYVMSVASGETHPSSEALSKKNLAIFKDGVTL